MDCGCFPVLNTIISTLQSIHQTRSHHLKLILVDFYLLDLTNQPSTTNGSDILKTYPYRLPLFVPVPTVTMHFATALVLSVLPSAFAAALPQEETGMVTDTFTTPSGEERTVQFNGALTKRKGPKAPSARNGYKAPQSYYPTADAYDPRDEPRDHCGDSTFHNYSGEGAPLVEDCQCLVDWYRGNNGQYSVNARGDEFVALGTCGTCAFGVKTKNVVGSIIGNTDIADIMQDAIRELTWEGVVAAEGDMGCWSIFDTARVDWAIFHKTE
ncbi:hypothetical protein IMZ48_33660 [Candidatus Bathyarchaeota archaeon]|nr:hypothetical protein [Candidatus Bathyarchaeota archaeon]